jgi:FixJ family two-component response regulator
MKTEATIVLLVEDDASVRSSLSRLLTLSGYEVRAFATAAELHDASLPLEKTACVLMDVYLPDGDGLELQRGLAERAPNLPVILMTARATDELRARALRGGAAGFLAKPLEADALLTEIERVLATFRQAS